MIFADLLGLTNDFLSANQPDGGHPVRLHSVAGDL